MLKARWKKYILNFKRPSGTSRGVMFDKTSYFIEVYNSENTQIVGIGECGILKGLSYDDRPDYEEKLTEVCQNINAYNNYLISGLREWPSIHFGLEMALRDLEVAGSKVLFQNKFSAGLSPILINGLVWMGEPQFMKDQIREKIDAGFSCIKMKIGAIDFDQEISLLKMIRQEFDADTIELRVDANGAFPVNEALEKLKILSDFEIHSIEQPIKAGHANDMHQLCSANVLPIALDEELIGVTTVREKRDLLDTIKPHYIILKPSLIGGFKGSLEWINLAEMGNIQWWITSALESNIGLNAIAQFTADFNNPLPQGLGTGALYTNNFDSPLNVSNGQLNYELEKPWNLSGL
jgi:o-succinylbenzoate synthase